MGICHSGKKNCELVVSNLNATKSNQRENCQDFYKGFILRYSRIKINKEIPICSNNFILLSGGLPLDTYESVKKLGIGAYGEVYLVKHKQTGILRAMKKLSTGKSKDDDKNKVIMNEVEILKKMDHPNIAKIIEFYHAEEDFFLITEFCPGGELFDKIHKTTFFEEMQVAYIMYQVLSAVYYCHNINIIHRDLKLENIMIESEEADNLINIKIIDFGKAKIFEKSVNESLILGSAYYMSPEMLDGKYNEKCDIWSCGVIMYILLCGRPPFDGQDEEIKEKIRIGRYDLKLHPWPQVSSFAKELLNNMLDIKSQTRITAQKSLNHKWFKKYKIKERFSSIEYYKLKKAIETLKTFSTESKIQQATLAFLVHNSLDLPEVKELAKIFKNLDQNGDGKITKDELGVAITKFYNVSNPIDEVNEIFHHVDNNNDGFIDYEEYLRACIDKKTLVTDDYLRLAFRFFDKDGSGAITTQEVAAILFPDQDIDSCNNKDLVFELVNEVDLDKNSKITFDEFKVMMKKLIK